MSKGTALAKFTIYLEPAIADAYARLCNKHDMSQSSYGRKLVLAELEARGLMTETLLLIAQSQVASSNAS